MNLLLFHLHKLFLFYFLRFMLFIFFPLLFSFETVFVHLFFIDR